MRAFLYGVLLQWRLDIRSKTLLITCYLVPLLFFAVMGGIFTAVLPDANETLISSMTIFGVTMGALIGLPPSLVEIYGSDIRKVYQANGLPVWFGLVLTNVSAALHLFLMSVILYAAAPLLFDAKLPAQPGVWFGGLFLFLVTSVAVSDVIGLLVKDPAKTPMCSILYFLPSILFSGIMFPGELLPEAFRTLGKLFPATWGFRLLSGGAAEASCVWPLLLILLLAGFFSAALAGRVRE